MTIGIVDHCMPVQEHLLQVVVYWLSQPHFTLTSVWLVCCPPPLKSLHQRTQKAYKDCQQTGREMEPTVVASYVIFRQWCFFISVMWQCSKYYITYWLLSKACNPLSWYVHSILWSIPCAFWNKKVNLFVTIIQRDCSQLTMTQL